MYTEGQISRARQVVEALKKNGFEVYHVDTAALAQDFILKIVPVGASVGIGGSVTIRQLDLPKEFKKRGNQVYDIWDQTLNAEELKATYLAHRTCDVFLCSTNAITIDGHLINVDGSGNRVSSMIFGPGKVIVVAGINKIVTDVEAGIRRAKSIVAPRLYQMKNSPVPCAKTGYCIDCHVPAKQCRVITIIEGRPRGNENFIVVLVNQELGI